MKKRKYLVTVLCLVITISGCNKTEQNTSVMQTEEPISTESATKDTLKNSGLPLETELMTEPTEETVIDEANVSIVSNQIDGTYNTWQEAYLDFLDNHENEYGSDSELNLLYLDDDEVPELLIDTNSGAGGAMIFSFYQGNLYMNYLERSGYVFREGAGLIYNMGGNTGYYPLHVDKLYQGQFYRLFDGLNIQNYTDSGEEINSYEIMDKEVTEKEFWDAIERTFGNTEDGTRPEYYYSVNEMKTLLQTGHNSSFGHRYEFVAEDITWEDAQKACHEKGGYLVTITSPGEIMAVRDSMKEEGKTSIFFYVGYQSCGWNGDVWEEEGWIEKDGTLTPSTLQTGFSYYYAPDYDDSSEWSDVRRRVGLVEYNAETDRIYLYEAPRDILSVSPEYAGKIGYICEFDE